MKNAQKIQMLTLVVIALIVALVSQWKPTLWAPAPTVVSLRPLSTRREVRRTPEFRPAPVKTSSLGGATRWVC